MAWFLNASPTSRTAREPRSAETVAQCAAAVVSKIELGEGDAAIVYATDARSSTGVTTIAVPDAAQVAATYGAVPVATSKSPAAAAAFIAWLAGPEAQAILKTFGFLPPS